MSDSVTPELLEAGCCFCFEVINAKLNGTEPPSSAQFDPSLKFPLFVTWSVKSKSRPGELNLRGCIGNFSSMPLGEGLEEYAKTSAFEDYRFNPITTRELPTLSCGISLLTQFEPASDPLDWHLGTHGIYVQLPNPLLFPSPTPAPPLVPSPSPSDPRPSYPSLRALPKYDVPPPASNPQRLPVLINATYLPDVAPAQGWTKREAVESAIRKAGWNGEIGEGVWASVRVTRYQSRKGELGYAEWRRRRGD